MLALGLRDFGDMHGVYLYTDMALADVLESFRDAIVRGTGLDPAH